MDPDPRSGDVPPLPRPPAATDWRDRLDQFRDLTVDALERSRFMRVVGTLAILAVAMAVAFVLLSARTSGPPVEARIPMLAPEAIVAPTAVAPEVVVVHVAGAVARPGLVHVDSAARIADAIAAAGGPTAEADLDRINLALPVRDADHVFVPRIGEEAPTSLGMGGSEADGGGPVDLNRADEEELDGLPGVGPATAAAIVAHRDQHGPFTSVSALEQVPGIGPAKLAQLRDLVTVS